MRFWVNLPGPFGVSFGRTVHSQAKRNLRVRAEMRRLEYIQAHAAEIEAARHAEGIRRGAIRDARIVSFLRWFRIVVTVWVAVAVLVYLLTGR